MPRPSLEGKVPKVLLVRRVRFSAGHHYRRPDWSEARNRERFGSSVHRHGHNYEVEVSVEGPVDPETGFVVELDRLDALLEEVVRPLDQRDLTETVPDFHPGEQIPTTENLGLWLWRQIETRVPGTARLRTIRVMESGDLATVVHASEGEERG